MSYLIFLKLWNCTWHSLTHHYFACQFEWISVLEHVFFLRQPTKTLVMHQSPSSMKCQRGISTRSAILLLRSHRDVMRWKTDLWPLRWGHVWRMERRWSQKSHVFGQSSTCNFSFGRFTAWENWWGDKRMRDRSNFFWEEQAFLWVWERWKELWTIAAVLWELITFPGSL